MNASVGAGTARAADLYADESASARDAFVLRLIADSTDAESIPASLLGLSNVARYKTVSALPSASDERVSFWSDCAFGIPTNKTLRIFPLSNRGAAQMLRICSTIAL